MQKFKQLEEKVLQYEKSDLGQKIKQLETKLSKDEQNHVNDNFSPTFFTLVIYTNFVQKQELKMVCHQLQQTSNGKFSFEIPDFQNETKPCYSLQHLFAGYKWYILFNQWHADFFCEQERMGAGKHFSPWIGKFVFILFKEQKRN